MTIRTFHARLMVAYALRIQEGQEASRTLTMGIGRLFSQEGADEMDKALAEALATIRAQAKHILAGRGVDAESLAAVGDEARKEANKPKVLSPEERERNTQRLIRKLDASMSMLTGTVIRNPALDGPQGDVTPFDLKNSSIADVMKRFDKGKS